MRYIVTTPWWLKMFYTDGLIWKMDEKEKNIYLTFDDGPQPVATPFVLDQLKKYDAKATFFCIGKNVADHPDVFKRILTEGHRIGNHTQNHLNGWKTGDEAWLKDIKEAAQWIDSDLFRPPYGKIKPFPAKLLLQASPPYKIIMWTVLSADFDVSKTGDQCYEHVRKHAKEGSIVVFHDSDKAWPRLQNALPKVLEYFSARDFQFKAIE